MACGARNRGVYEQTLTLPKPGHAQCAVSHRRLPNSDGAVGLQQPVAGSVCGLVGRSLDWTGKQRVMVRF